MFGLFLLCLVALPLLAAIVARYWQRDDSPDIGSTPSNDARESEPISFARQQRLVNPRAEVNRQLTCWWDAVPTPVKFATETFGEQTNIHPGDYAGPESCRTCHAENYESWSKHTHRWMNTVASEATVMGDFWEVRFPTSVARQLSIARASFFG
jgi:hypothetical protein